MKLNHAVSTCLQFKQLLDQEPVQHAVLEIVHDKCSNGQFLYLFDKRIRRKYLV